MAYSDVLGDMPLNVKLSVMEACWKTETAGTRQDFDELARQNRELDELCLLDEETFLNSSSSTEASPTSEVFSDSSHRALCEQHVNSL